MKSVSILAEASSLISGYRQDDYGNADESFEGIAKMWSVLKGVEFTAGDVGRFMIAFKLARLAKSPSHEDSYIDIAGYAALTGAIDIKDEDVKI